MSAPAGLPPPGGGTWIDMASRAIVQVGFPVVVAGVLLWYLLTRFDGVITRLEHNAQVLDAFVREMQAQTVEIKAQTQAVTAIAKDSKSLVELHEKEQRQKEKTP